MVKVITSLIGIGQIVDSTGSWDNQNNHIRLWARLGLIGPWQCVRTPWILERECSTCAVHSPGPMSYNSLHPSETRNLSHFGVLYGPYLWYFVELGAVICNLSLDKYYQHAREISWDENLWKLSILTIFSRFWPMSPPPFLATRNWARTWKCHLLERLTCEYYAFSLARKTTLLSIIEAVVRLSKRKLHRNFSWGEFCMEHKGCLRRHFHRVPR